MAKPFDATLNSLLDAHVEDWAEYLAGCTGLAPGPVESLDTDLSTTLQADRLFRLSGATPALLHLELESTGHRGIPDELLRYNVTARAISGLPVHTVVLLLRPKATAADLTGMLEVSDAKGAPYLTFRYTVVRLWQESVESLLDAGLGVLPLALLTNEAAQDLPVAFQRYYQRLQATNAPDRLKDEVLGLSSVLWGLRYDSAQIGGMMMALHRVIQDSSVYQEAIRNGTVSALQGSILRQGRKRFSGSNELLDARVKAIDDPIRLERILDRVIDAQSWDDLLATE